MDEKQSLFMHLRGYYCMWSCFSFIYVEGMLLINLWMIHFRCNSLGVASIVKWTTLDPCTCLSESDSEEYTNFVFLWKIHHTKFKNILMYKAKQMLLTKKSQISLHVLEDNASGVQVMIFEQVIVKILFKIWSNSIEFVIFYIKIWRWPRVYNEFKKYGRGGSKLKIVKVMKLRPQPNLAICSCALLLMITFEDLVLVFYIWVLNSTIEVSNWFRHNILDTIISFNKCCLNRN